MGSIDHLTRYIPNLAQTAAAMRPFLKKHREKQNNFLETGPQYMF